MPSRFNPAASAPDGYNVMLAMEQYLAGTGLGTLLRLIKLRVSQINGCAFCIDMHWKDLRAAGETEQRLYGLDAWRESTYYTDRERAALEWAEAVTLVTKGHVSDAAFESARAQFDGKSLSDLTLAITTINAWNRLAIAARTPAGHYKAAAAT